MRGHTATAFQAVAFHSQLLFTLRYELGISPLLTAVTLGSHTDVIRVQAMLAGIGPLRRLRSPMPQLDHVLGLYPETAGRSSRERFAFEDTARWFGLACDGSAGCVRHLTCQVLMDPPDRIDKKGDWYSTSRLLIKLYLVLSADLNHYSDQDQWFPRYIE